MDGRPMLYSIHFLRFLAATAVVIHHGPSFFKPNFNVFAAGVDVFFVISGIVIGIKGPETAPNEFLMKRLIRIFPLYWVAILLSAAVPYFQWGHLPELHTVALSIAPLPLQDPGWLPIYYPAWTLGFELLFYFSFYLILRLKAGAPNTWAIVLMVAVGGSYIPLPFVPSGHLQSDLMLEFAAGLLIAEFIRSGSVVSKNLGIACFALSLGIFTINAFGSYGGSRVVTFGIPSVLLVLGMLSIEKHAILRTPLAIYCGEISYAIYLVHLTVIEFIRARMQMLGINYFDHPFWSLIATLLLTWIMAAALWSWFEMRTLNGLRNLLRRDKPVGTQPADSTITDTTAASQVAASRP